MGFFHGLNPRGAWHKPGHLDPKRFSRFLFKWNWNNLSAAYNLRILQMNIAPEHSKFLYSRSHELEKLHDEISYYHVSRSWIYFLTWVGFTWFYLDLEEMDRPFRHWRVPEKWAHDEPYVRMTFMRDNM